MEQDEAAPCEDLLPGPEALARLRALTLMCGLTSASRLAPRTEADRHLLTHGHRLCLGCCKRSWELEDDGRG